MVAQREPQHMTVDEWRELERTSHDTKHEYIDGQAYAMLGQSLAHGRIGSNAARGPLASAMGMKGRHRKAHLPRLTILIVSSRISS